MAREIQAALVALHRFGLGARGGASGDLIRAASDPRGFVKAEFSPANAALLQSPGLLSTPALADRVFAYQAEIKQARAAAKQEPASPRDDDRATSGQLGGHAIAMEMPVEPQATRQAENAAAAMQPTEIPAPTPAHRPLPPQNIIQQTFRAEALARLQRAAAVDCGLIERLVAFWSNHFCISARKGELSRIWAGAFEREAIRPHVLGRFGDMLQAVEQHPAMLFFLDNQQSLGPDSVAGQNRKRGLNENLAREIMELHTLGVGGGYSQQDVSALAQILTGWTFAGRQGRLGAPGSFVFNANAHQPGAQVLLGKTYGDDGVAQGEAALTELARHPATARFIATKFVRHFVADDPPPALVARLSDVFETCDGDLRALTMALIDSDEAWQAPLTKLRSPYDFLVATGRLLAHRPEDPGPALGGLNLLGQPLWSPSGPNGFPDSNAAWAAPEGMKLRLDVAARAAAQAADLLDPRDLLELALAEAASPETRRAIERAESRQQALALLLMSPEFQRR